MKQLNVHLIECLEMLDNTQKNEISPLCLSRINDSTKIIIINPLNQIESLYFSKYSREDLKDILIKK